MRLHRLLATAAVTAVVGPVALFVAPVAYAEGEEPGAASPSASVAPTTPAPTSAAPTPPAPSASESAKPTASESAKPSAEPSPTYTRPTFCSGIPEEERGKTSLRGLPSKIVAGSGWHDFTYRVTNVSETKVMETVVSLYLGTADPKLDDIAELAVTVEWFDPAAGKWKAIEGDGAEVLGNEEFATVETLEPGEYADAKMRIKVGGDAKAGTGYFFTIGHSYGEDGQCGFDDISRFDFTVLARGSEPGPVDEAEGKPGTVDDIGGDKGEGGTSGGSGSRGGEGRGGNGPAAQGRLGEIPVSGKLAQTGSSSAVPTFAVIGGVAVAAGAGAVLVARRRKAGSVA
ncbi:LPXTG cell wall anchor domain-containing protein [Streptomyces sp. NA04227]|uniref:LPXTG cell wall anchor domain-containing protein n=1 Tax=Streptomyces sp. NA04227 TaxID=2742136 RepID=UPI001591EFA5|nr:LPXTG cell wall anchor domain-containing protein [Streptomyces sp. NA04227]QKW09357.1 LPXTG cell wall anchor domain-containing protein [Streptomyces sp. NA04227]